MYLGMMLDVVRAPAWSEFTDTAVARVSDSLYHSLHCVHVRRYRPIKLSACAADLKQHARG